MGQGGREEAEKLKSPRAPMRFEISHSIAYSYDRAVFLEPLTVRLRPRCDSTQRLEHYSLNVEPHPAGLSECVDIDGNNTATVWFDGTHRHVGISAKSQIEVLRANPLDFIFTDDGVSHLPATYNDEYRQAMEPYLRPSHGCSRLQSLVEPMVEESGGETIAFLMAFASHINGRFPKVLRESGGPLTPDETIALGQGACRDLALMFMEGCKSVGLAARFVSGYAGGHCLLAEPHMHAWAEVYLPGGGWRGFDPTIGLAVAGQHVAVAAAANPADAAPTTGTYRGTDVESKLEYEVSMQRIR